MGESGVYQIRSIRDGKLYIGSAVDISKRWKLHINRLNLDKHHAHHLRAAWVKYGSENFVFEVVEYCDKSQLIEREQHYIDGLKPEYNTSPTAGSRQGVKASYETRAKTSVTWAIKKFIQEHGKYPTSASVKDFTDKTIARLIERDSQPAEYDIANFGVFLGEDITVEG